MAARFDQGALVNPALGHGLFTYAIVEGLIGKGDLGAKRRISTRDLTGYVVRGVGESGEGAQGRAEAAGTSRAAMRTTTCWRSGRTDRNSLLREGWKSIPGIAEIFLASGGPTMEPGTSS